MKFLSKNNLDNLPKSMTLDQNKGINKLLAIKAEQLEEE